jgi:DNA-binding beta-propeller fold protein YncE
MKHFSGLVATLAACSAALFGAGGEWQAFVTSEPSNIPGAVVPIGLSSYVQGNFVSVDAAPTSIAITPDAKWALVTNDSSEEITVLALTESPITTYTVSTAAFGEPTNIGITPDGKRAVVICNPFSDNPQSKSAEADPGSDFFVATLDLTTNPFSLEPSTVQVPSADSLAITPDSKRVLIGSNASGGASLTVVDLTTTPISIDANFITGLFGGGIAVTPDGKMALGVVRGLNAVSVVDLTATPNPVQIHTVFVGNRPSDIAITPDGKKAFVTCLGTDPQIIGKTPGITVLDLTTTPVSVETLLVPLSFAPGRIAIEPDGKKAVVTTRSNLFAGQAELALLRAGSGVSILDLTTSPLSVIPTNDFVIPGPTDVAITPDQAPTARFTSERDGDKVTFNASSSTSPIGEIAKYKWNFGDGHKKTTTSPIVTHKYHDLPNPKSHDGGDKPIMVTLTVTNTAGTSTDVTFTGRTVSNNGGPSAVCRQPLIASPQNFTGTIKMGHGKKNILLKTTWTKSPTKGIKRYEIFAHDTKIASISAKDSLHKTIRLNNLPEEISDTVLQDIVGPRYRIRAVVDDKVVSPFVSLTVVQ